MSSISSASQQECLNILHSYLLTIPEDPTVDYRAVLLAADRVKMRTSGRVSPRAFLLTRVAILGYRSPLEVMAEPNGTDLVERAADAVIQQRGLSRSR